MSLAPSARRRAPRAERGFLDTRPLATALGTLLIILAMFMVPPMLVDLVVGHPDWQTFLASAAITVFAGVSLRLVSRGGATVELSGRQAFLLTVLAWLVLTAFGTLPLYFSSLELSLTDAFFEAMSGLTTTGATVISGLDTAPPGLLLWRSTLQWLGGVGIVVMGIAILPILSIGGMQLFRAENSDRSEKILPRAAQIASRIGTVYVLLTALCALCYLAAGMAGFDALNHAMTTIATAGFSTHDASLGHYQDVGVEIVAVVFMIAGGVPFVLYVRALTGDFRDFAHDEQLRWYLLVLLGAWAMMTANLVLTDDVPLLPAFRYAAVNVTSVITTTGYATLDFGLWGDLAVAMFFLMMCVGGCTGGTTGGIKIFRFIVLYLSVVGQLKRTLQPNTVFAPRFNGRPLPETAALAVMAFFFLYALTFTATVLVLSFFDLDFLTAMSAAATSLGNVGPGLGDEIGPATTFASLPDGAKYVLCVAMLLGRLELFTVFVLLLPAFWRP